MRIKSRTRKLASSITRLLLGADTKRFISMEMEKKPKNIKHNIKLLRKGFFTQREEIYPFDEYSTSLFLTDWEIETKMRKINPEEIKILIGNKLYFHLYMAKFCENNPLPKLIAYGNRRHLTYSTGLSFTDEQEFIAKPISGRSGEGVEFIRIGADVLSGLDDYVIEEKIQQHNYSQSIYPKSINTIRIVVLRDPTDGEPFIGWAAHRFGSKGTGITDSFKHGGLSSLINISTGILSAGKKNPDKTEAYEHIRHPDTDEPIEGVQVPYWEETKKLALTCTSLFSQLQLCGWDICITPSGPRLIEGNPSVPNPNLVQVHQPALLSPAVARFFEHHGVCKRTVSR